MERLAVLLALCSHINIVSSSVDYSCLHASAWLMNDGSVASKFSNVKTNIVTSALSSASNLWTVSCNRIPNYDRVFTASDIVELNSRPKKATDFVTAGATTAVAGTSYAFGANIGYVTTGCSLGYWPPGPACPTSVSKTVTFTVRPSYDSTGTGCIGNKASVLGSIGTLVNGIAIYGLGDGLTYNSGGVWYNSAGVLELYDVDVCGGHAANGDYHQHFYPKCLAEKLGDTGTAHSSVYGFMADSFPIYGPYQASGLLAKSCWKKRDYSSGLDGSGCDTPGRTCVYADTIPGKTSTRTALASTKYGPATTATVTSQSGNSFTAASGMYEQDFYYDSECFAAGGEYLDAHNGHDHDSHGYHYHFTVEDTATMTAAYPYVVGPYFKGCTGCGSKTQTPPPRPGSPMNPMIRGGHEHAMPTATLQGTSTCSSDIGYTTTYGCSGPIERNAPSASPSAPPSAAPTATPAATPTAVPTARPTPKPGDPTFAPTTAAPSAVPTTASPTPQPTAAPSLQPTAMPSARPTITPTALATRAPTTTKPPTPFSTLAPTVAATTQTVPVMKMDAVVKMLVEGGCAAFTSLASQGVISSTTCEALSLPANLCSYSSCAAARRALSSDGFQLLDASFASPSTTIAVPEDQFSTLFPGSGGGVAAIAAEITSTLTASVNSKNFTAILKKQADAADVAVLENATASSVTTTDPVVQYPPTAMPTSAPDDDAAFPLYAIIIIVVVGGTLLLGGAAAGVFMMTKGGSSVAVAPHASPV